ncbi:MAG: helix-turn-helix transcriptional regulator [Clostridiales bacterium]|nr:helix-turn-helix transcriptional regulator [Clostridiales bacterium]
MKIFTPKAIKNSPYTVLITYPPEELHRNTFFKIMFVEGGEATLTLYSKKNEKEQKHLNIKVGDMIIVAPQDVTQYSNVQTGANGYRHRDIYISVEKMKECCDFLSDTLYDEIVKNPFAIDYRMTINQQLALSEMLTPLLNKKENEFCDLQHKSIVVYCLNLYLQHKAVLSVYPLWLHDLLRKLEKQEYYLLPVEQIAKSTNYSHEYVSRKFKYYIGKSLKKYVNECRLSSAALLLATSDLSIEEISYKSGFPSCSNFINAFKKEYNVSPGKYRKDVEGKVANDTYFEWIDD